jgi:urease
MYSLTDPLQTVYGDEVKFGGGKTIREGMGQATGRSSSETLDLVITNALIVDWEDIYKVHCAFTTTSCMS